MALFWLSDEAWGVIEPHLPTNQPGARRVDDRRVISGILHMRARRAHALPVGRQACPESVEGGYDADHLRRSLREVGTTPAIPGRRNRKRAIPYDKKRYRDRHLIENAFCRMKDFRRVATRYDKLAANFLSGVALVTAFAFWL